MEIKREKVIGFNVDLITLKEAINFLVERIQKKQGTHVVTINPEIIESAKKTKKLKTVIDEAQLVVPDGTGIQLALRMKGIKQERIPGIDLSVELLEKAESLGFSVALIGAKQHVLEKAETAIRKNLPNLRICYSHNGYFTAEKEETIINELSILRPDITLVALGSPKQEFFIKNCMKKQPCSIYIGIGGSFDVWAGVVERAPEFFRIMGCEWVYRTFKQPERLKRIYKTLPLFTIEAIIEALKYRFCAKGKNNDEKP